MQSGQRFTWGEYYTYWHIFSAFLWRLFSESVLKTFQILFITSEFIFTDKSFVDELYQAGIYSIRRQKCSESVLLTQQAQALTEIIQITWRKAQDEWTYQNCRDFHQIHEHLISRVQVKVIKILNQLLVNKNWVSSGKKNNPRV